MRLLNPPGIDGGTIDAHCMQEPCSFSSSEKPRARHTQPWLSTGPRGASRVRRWSMSASVVMCALQPNPYFRSSTCQQIHRA